MSGNPEFRILVVAQSVSHTIGIKKKREEGKMIIGCSCKNMGQDEMYGKGIRFANPCKPKLFPSQKWVRCTVCGKEQQVLLDRKEVKW